jgi:hypothetical protein
MNIFFIMSHINLYFFWKKCVLKGIISKKNAINIKLGILDYYENEQL